MTTVQVETGILREAMAKMLEDFPTRITAAIEAACYVNTSKEASEVQSDMIACGPGLDGKAHGPGVAEDEAATRLIRCEGCGRRVSWDHADGWGRTVDDCDLCPKCWAEFVAEAESGAEETTAPTRTLYRTRFQFVEFHPGRSREHRWRAKDPRPHDGNARPELGCFATEAEATLAVLTAICGTEISHTPYLTRDLLISWIAASRRKAARVAAEPERSAYACEVTA